MSIRSKVSVRNSPQLFKVRSKRILKITNTPRKMTGHSKTARSWKTKMSQSIRK